MAEIPIETLMEWAMAANNSSNKARQHLLRVKHPNNGKTRWVAPIAEAEISLTLEEAMEEVREAHQILSNSPICTVLTSSKIYAICKKLIRNLNITEAVLGTKDMDTIMEVDTIVMAMVMGTAMGITIIEVMDTRALKVEVVTQARLQPRNVTRPSSKSQLEIRLIMQAQLPYTFNKCRPMNKVTVAMTQINLNTQTTTPTTLTTMDTTQLTSMLTTLLAWTNTTLNSTPTTLKTQEHSLIQQLQQTKVPLINNINKISTTDNITASNNSIILGTIMEPHTNSNMDKDHTIVIRLQELVQLQDLIQVDLPEDPPNKQTKRIFEQQNNE